MDSATLLTVIAAALEPRVRAAGGVIELASDPDEVISLLAAGAPSTWRLILNWAGEEAVDETTAPGLVYFSLGSTVQAATGLHIEPGAWAVKTNAAGRDPLLTLSSSVGRWIRGLSGSHPDLHDAFRFQSAAFLEVENIPTKQIMSTHRLIMALEDPIDTPCQFPQTASSAPELSQVSISVS